MNVMEILFFVIPCYNDEAVLNDSSAAILKKLSDLIESEQISDLSRILFVNDGSTDATWSIIEELCTANRHFCGISLAHNKGHQNALLAGLMLAKENADMAISMDADLQDDIEIVDEMIAKYRDGCDIVCGVRRHRDKDSFFKRKTAELFYKSMRMLGVDTIYNHADYRLMSKKALDALAQYKEVNLYLQGIIPLLGYKVGYVYYDRRERLAGQSKYPLRKILGLAWEGISSFSIIPVRLVTFTGIIVFLISLIMLVYSLIRHAIGATVVGWSSLMISVWMIGGLILLGLGIIGEYIGKIYLEMKARPRYTIEKEISGKNKDLIE